MLSARITLYRKIVFYWELLKESIVSFIGDDMLTHAAAISYYTVFSLPSMLIIVLWSAGKFYGEVAVQGEIFQKINSLVGEEASQQVLSILQKLNLQEPTWLTTVSGIVVLLFFATTVYDVIRTALNKIAQVTPSDSVGRNIWLALRVRFIAVALLVSSSFFLLVSLMLDVILSTLSQYLADSIGVWSEYDGFLLDLIAVVLVFTLYFRYLPDIRLKWSDAFWGAVWTAGLFVMGKSLISIFIRNNQVVDLYDAAGSLLIFMLWIYYAAIIFLFGATFTFHRARKKQSIPSNDGETLDIVK